MAYINTPLRMTNIDCGDYMKVAIIGAGPSGLACAIQLERAGITPDIFEINNRIGEKHSHIATILQIINRPIKEPLKYMNDIYDLNLRPYAINRKIAHNGPNSSSVITGNLGYFIYRGQENYSLENQLASMVKTKINFNTYIDYKKIKSQYDYVIIATGKKDEAKELGIWQDIISTYVKGAIVLGEFETDTLMVWLNKYYCNRGYAYLTPFNEKRASLILITTEAEESEIDKYWDLFISTANIKYEAVEYFTRAHYGGYVYPHKVDNIYFVGNAAGAIDPFLGFGQISSIITGSEAGKSIVQGLDYEKQIKTVIDTNLKLGEFRKSFNSLNNDGLDMLIKSIGLPGVNTLVYDTNINVLSLGTMAIKAHDFIFGDKL